jgi:hypothetical protein
MGSTLSSVRSLATVPDEDQATVDDEAVLLDCRRLAGGGLNLLLCEGGVGASMDRDARPSERLAARREMS